MISSVRYGAPAYAAAVTHCGLGCPSVLASGDSAAAKDVVCKEECVVLPTAGEGGTAIRSK
eukprot:12884819-Prorocentrum_lima.AAC.1